MKSGKFLERLAWAPFLFLVLLAGYGATNLMVWDDWIHIKWAIVLIESGHWEPGLFFSRHFSSIPALPRALYWICVRFFHADIRFLVACNLLCIGGTQLLLGAALRRRMEPGWGRGLALCFLGTIVASPSQWFLIATGWGFMWLIMPLLLGAALWVHDRKVSFGAAFAAYFTIALLGSLTLGHGLIFWLVLPGLLIVQFGSGTAGRRWGAIALWAAGAGLLFYGHLHHPHYDISAQTAGGDANPVQALHHPSVLIRFLLGLMGGFAGQLGVRPGGAAVFGLLLETAYATGVVLYLRQYRRTSTGERLLPWLLIGGFHLLACGLIASGRSGAFDLSRSLSMHYVALSLYLLLAVGLLAFQIPGGGAARDFLIAVAALGALLNLAALPVGAVHFIGQAGFRQLARSQLALMEVIPIEPGFSDTLTPENLPLYERYHAVTVFSKDQLAALFASRDQLAAAGRWSGDFSRRGEAGSSVLHLAGTVRGPIFGPRPDAAVVRVRAADGTVSYGCFRLLPSAGKTLRAHDGKLVSDWSGEMAVSPGAQIDASALVIDRAALLPLRADQ